MASLYTYALCSVADVKESLGISGSSQDNLIIRKINQATDIIESFCNLPRDHHFKQATYTNEYYDGSSSNTLTLKMVPVTTITSFKRHDSPESGSSYSDVESNLYYSDLSSGVIKLLFNTTNDWNGYSITYTAGYSTIPYDLQEACVTLAGYFVQNGSAGTNVKRKQEGARSIEYFQQQGSTSLLEDLGLDDQLNRYIYYAVGT